jgi:hypothetical protein
MMFKAIKEFLFGTPAATVQPVVKEPFDPGVTAEPTKPKKKRTFVKRDEGTAKPKATPAKPKTTAQAKPKAQPAAATTAPKKTNNRRRKPKDWSVK